ncbi:MAG: MotA/TolQ/ExbB proton channel family protein [Paracoccaceae bacterium]
MLTGLIDVIGAGGPIIVVLLVLSFASIALIVVKTIQLWNCRSGAYRRSAALQLWRSGRRNEARQRLAGGKSPADRVAAYAMDGFAAGLDREALDAEVERRGNDEIERMMRHLRLLEVIAMISPLLGLLGTVLGMIQSFQELELAQGSANASVLAGGIWQALLTTAAGLIVAIPAAIAANLLAARVEGASHLIEDTVGQLFLIEDGGSPPKGRSQLAAGTG